MSTSHALPRIPPVIRRMPAKTQFDYRARRAAQKRKQRIILWSILGGIAFLSAIIFFSSIGNSREAKERKIAALALQLERATTSAEQERIMAQIDKLEQSLKEKPKVIKIEMNKPFKITTEWSTFKINFDMVWLYEDTSGYDEERIKFVVSYSYMNLGPREGEPDISGGGVVTTKGHIYGLIDAGSGRDGPPIGSELFLGILPTRERQIDKEGRGVLFGFLPKGSEFPVEFSVCGDVNGTIKLPKQIPLKRAGRDVEDLDETGMVRPITQSGRVRMGTGPADGSMSP